MQGDISKYFPSTRHSVAIDKIVRVVRDKEAAACAAAIIESFSVPVIKKALLDKNIGREFTSTLSYNLSLLRISIVTAYVLHPETLDDTKDTAFKKALSMLPARKFSNDEAAKFADWIVNGDFRGVGLGSQVSQLVELLVLNDLDHFIKERLHIKHYVRYMDDFILIHEDEEYLRYCMKEINAHVQELGLSLNHKTDIYPIRHGIRILKWKFVLTDTGKIIMKMNPKSITREKRKLRKLKRKVDANEIDIKNAQESIASWIANAERGDTKTVVHNMKQYFKKLFNEEVA